MTEAKTAPNGGYTAANMTVLDGLEAVRKRPGMYIGSNGTSGLTHLVYEIVDNGVDEALAGYATKVTVVLHDDGSVTVADDGRGIPTDVNTKLGLTGVEIAYTKLHGGGKFGGSGYAKGAGGLHGVGASVVNALSDRLEVRVYRDGNAYDIAFRRGVTGTYHDDGTFTPHKGRGTALTSGKDTRTPAARKARPTGTTVRWWYDKTVFTDDATYDVNEIRTRMRQTAFLVPGLTLALDDRRAGNPNREEYRFDGGVADMVEHITPAELAHPVVTIRGNGQYGERVQVIGEDGRTVAQDVTRDVTVEAAFAWTTGYDTEVRTFANVVATRNGGTHLKGFERALSKVIVTSVRDKRGLLKPKEDAPTLDDLREGLTAVVSVTAPELQFIGQTKDELGSPEIARVVQQVITDGLTDFLAARKNAATVQAIQAKVVGAMRSRVAARTVKETARRKTALQSASMPAKLVDCAKVGTEHTELLICEGDSALGTLKAARDSEFQALLPIRGKILNVLKATPAKMLENAECAAIAQVIGAGVGRDFDSDQMRVARVILAADADVDGNHIRVLLITFFWRYMRPLIEEGRLYTAVPPLYVLKTKGKNQETIYLPDDATKDATIAQLDKAGRKYEPLQRLKGLGEMDAEEFWDTTLNPESRTLRQITIGDAHAAEHMLNLAMGDDVGPRKDWITVNRTIINDEEIDI